MLMHHKKMIELIENDESVRNKTVVFLSDIVRCSFETVPGDLYKE